MVVGEMGQVESWNDPVDAAALAASRSNRLVQVPSGYG